MTQARNLARLLNKQMTTYKYTASAAQTSFVDSDDAGLVLSYTPNNLIVTYNGVVLENGSEYTATNGTNVVLADAADAAAEVNIIAFQSASLGGYLEITGGTIGGNLNFPDNTKATFGAELEIYSDATHARIREYGGGQLKIQGDNMQLLTSAGTATYLEGNASTGAVTLYHAANAPRISTTATGIDVTGNVELSANNSLILNSTSTAHTNRINWDYDGTTYAHIGRENSTGAMQFTVQSAERMRISSSGNVGIGTVAPEKQLHITTITDNGGSITGGADRQGSVIRLQHTINHEVGYTGGDFLGGLEFFSGDGSAGTGVRTAIRTSADDPYNTHSLRFYTASSNSTTLNETMRINHHGWVTMPYQPSWGAIGLSNANVSAGTANTNETLVFSSVVNNTGNHYNSSTGVFTAPVTGRYFVTFSGLYNASDNTIGPVQIRVAGATKYTAYHHGSGSYYEQISVSGVVNAVAGDAITIYSVIDGWHTGGETSWSGFLIG